MADLLSTKIEELLTSGKEVQELSVDTLKVDNGDGTSTVVISSDTGSIGYVKDGSVVPITDFALEAAQDKVGAIESVNDYFYVKFDGDIIYIVFHGEEYVLRLEGLFLDEEKFASPDMSRMTQTGNVILFADIFDGVDLEWTVTPKSLTEKFILRSNPLVGKRVGTRLRNDSKFTIRWSEVYDKEYDLPTATPWAQTANPHSLLPVEFTVNGPTADKSIQAARLYGARYPIVIDPTIYDGTTEGTIIWGCVCLWDDKHQLWVHYGDNQSIQSYSLSGYAAGGTVTDATWNYVIPAYVGTVWAYARPTGGSTKIVDYNGNIVTAQTYTISNNTTVTNWITNNLGGTAQMDMYANHTDTNPAQSLSVSDTYITFTYTESSGPNKSETVTLSESNTVSVSDPKVNTSDTATVTDTVTDIDVSSGTVAPAEISGASETATVADFAQGKVTTDISSTDSVTLSESIGSKVGDPQVSGSDSVTVTDTTPSLSVGSPQISKSETVSVADSPTVITSTLEISESESVTVLDRLYPPLASEIITIAEVINLSIPIDISISSTVTVADTVSDVDVISYAAEYYEVSGVTDTVVVSDQATVKAELLEISESETVTVSDAASLYVDVKISASETVTVSDTATVATDGAKVSVSESVAVTDIPTLQVISRISVQDSVSATDTTPTVRVFAPWFNVDEFYVSVGAVQSGEYKDTWNNDGTNFVLTEVTGTPGFAYDFYFNNVTNPALVKTFDLHGYYEGNPGHNVKLQQWNFTSSQWVDATPNTRDYPSAATEQEKEVGVQSSADYISNGQMRFRINHSTAGNGSHLLYIDQIYLAAHESIYIEEPISVTDTASGTVSTPLVSVSDTVTVSDVITNITVGVPGAFEITRPENVAVSDVVTIATSAIAISVSESASITDTQTVKVSDCLISKTDSTTVSESTQVTVSNPSISTSESCTVTDSGQGYTSGSGAYASDTITVVDSQTVKTSDPAISTSESINIVEAVTSRVSLNLSTSDTLSIADTAISLVSLLQLNVSETITVSEAVSALIDKLHISKSETISVTEQSSLLIPVLYLSQSESITLTDSSDAYLLDIGVLQIDETENVYTEEELSYWGEDIWVTDIPYISVVSSVSESETVTVVANGTCAFPQAGPTLQIAITPDDPRYWVEV